jgi:hypothetical protein
MMRDMFWLMPKSGGKKTVIGDTHFAPMGPFSAHQGQCIFPQ